MTELIEKIDTLRRWKRQGIIKVTLAFKDDDFDTILNQIEIAVKNISSKPVLCDSGCDCPISNTDKVHFCDKCTPKMYGC